MEGAHCQDHSQKQQELHEYSHYEYSYLHPTILLGIVVNGHTGLRCSLVLEGVCDHGCVIPGLLLQVKNWVESFVLG